MGEGDCDWDNDCKGNLVCGSNNCAGSTFDSTDDCCTDPDDGDGEQFALLKCEIEVNPVAQIVRATSTKQFQFARCWWPRESMLWGSLHFPTLKVRILKVLTLCQSAKVKQGYPNSKKLIYL